MQNFADPPFTRLEEIFVILIFASSLHKDHTHVYNNTWYDGERVQWFSPILIKSHLVYTGAVDQLFMYHVRALKLAGLARLALARSHARMRIRARVNLKFRGSYFRGSWPIREKREILHHAKISRYTVAYYIGLWISVWILMKHVSITASFVCEINGLLGKKCEQEGMGHLSSQ